MTEATMPASRDVLVRFGDFEADARSFELRRNGVKVPVQSQPLQLLFALLERPGELLTRDELAQALWPDQPYLQLDDGLNTAVSKLRQVLDDDPASPRFIETVPRHGYRFVGELELSDLAPDPPVRRLRVSRPMRFRWAALIWPATESDEPGVGAFWPGLERVPVKILPSESSARSRRAIVRAVALAGAAVVAAGLVAMLLRKVDWPARVTSREATTAASARGIRSIAVLPLLNLSEDPEQRYFSDGITEALIDSLGRISTLKVVSRTSSGRFRDTDLSLREIARELGVDGIIEGSVQHEGDTVRISAKLIDAATDRQVWGAAYERELTGVLQLQSEVARAVADSVAAEVSKPDAARLAGAREVNPATYEAYLRGRHFIDKATPEGLQKGMAFLQQAVDLDPADPLGYAGLASGNVMLSHETGDPEYVRRAKAAARRALELDSSNAEAQAVLAMVGMYFDQDWDGAEAAFRRALELNPSQAEVYIHFAFLLLLDGRYSEAASLVERARQLDPLSPSVTVYLAEFYWPMGRYEKAAEAASRALELSPVFPHAEAWLAQAYRGMGRYDDALVHARRAAESNPRWLPYLGIVLAAAGHREEARDLLEELVATAEDRILVELACFQALVGDLDSAMETLERAAQAREVFMPWIGSVFEFGALADDPRFRRLLEEMDLELVRPELLAAAESSG